MRNNGGLVFISAGNDGNAYDSRDSREALFVGALNPAGTRASFSTYGPFVDLVAPGAAIVVPTKAATMSTPS